MDTRRAHTSEHIFMRALYQVNSSVKVLKVIHKPDINQVIIEARDLDWSDIVKASEITNMIILEDRPVYIEEYNSFETAKKKYPELRAYEERIKPPIRVVIVDKYDYAACSMPHVDSTGECIFFLPVAFRKAKRNRYEIDFLVGEQAMEQALQSQMMVHKISLITGGRVDNIVDIIKKLYEGEKILSRRVRRLTRDIFELSPTIKNKFEIKAIEAQDIDMNEIGYMASRWLEEGGRIIIAIDIGEKKRTLIACSEDINIDLRSVGREIFDKFGGKGGGRERWIMGYIDRAEGLIEFIRRKIEDLCN
jgi:alanyl-tRNA synthetase